jgi:hypothetical protein
VALTFFSGSEGAIDRVIFLDALLELLEQERAIYSGA